MLKRTLKQFCYIVATVLVSPLALAELLARRMLARDVFFQTHNEVLSLIPGKTGSFLRNAYAHLTLKRCPLECFLSFGVIFMHSQAELGERVYIGAHCLLGLANVGDDTMFADHVYLLSGGRQHGASDPAVRFQDQQGTFTRINIGKNCWLGTNTVVMADIGDHCVIGAGSVVTRAIPSGSVAVGNPARVIRPTFPGVDQAEAALQQSTITND